MILNEETKNNLIVEKFLFYFIISVVGRHFYLVNSQKATHNFALFFFHWVLNATNFVIHHF